MTSSESAIDTLVTVRDWWRYAVSRFNTAGLSYGHGTTNARDDAAFLILETLRLPIDELEPWLDARLLRDERMALANIVDLRIATRKPSAYLVNAAYIRNHRFFVDERAIVPRSYIGEILADEIGTGDSALPLPDPQNITTVLDLCTGGGSLAVLAALAFPHASIDAVDISADALSVARHNVANFGIADRVTLTESDLFAALEGRTYDLIISNPPYVTDAAAAAFPPEHHAEPKLAHAGGPDGLRLVRRILAEVGKHLNSEGYLVVEIGQARGALEDEFPDLPFLWIDTAESEGEVFALSSGDLAGKAKPPRRTR